MKVLLGFRALRDISFWGGSCCNAQAHVQTRRLQCGSSKASSEGGGGGGGWGEGGGEIWCNLCNKGSLSCVLWGFLSK